MECPRVLVDMCGGENMHKNMWDVLDNLVDCVKIVVVMWVLFGSGWVW